MPRRQINPIHVHIYLMRVYLHFLAVILAVAERSQLGQKVLDVDELLARPGVQRPGVCCFVASRGRNRVVLQVACSFVTRNRSCIGFAVPLLSFFCFFRKTKSAPGEEKAGCPQWPALKAVLKKLGVDPSQKISSGSLSEFHIFLMCRALGFMLFTCTGLRSEISWLTKTACRPQNTLVLLLATMTCNDTTPYETTVCLAFCLPRATAVEHNSHLSSFLLSNEEPRNSPEIRTRGFVNLQHPAKSLQPRKGCEVKAIHLEFLDAPGAVDEQIGKLRSLRHFSLQGTKTGGDLASFANSPQLQWLDLRNTQVSGDVSSLSKCSQLEWLDLTNTLVSGDISSPAVVAGPQQHTRLR